MYCHDGRLSVNLHERFDRLIRLGGWSSMRHGTTTNRPQPVVQKVRTVRDLLSTRNRQDDSEAQVEKAELTMTITKAHSKASLSRQRVSDTGKRSGKSGGRDHSAVRLRAERFVTTEINLCRTHLSKPRMKRVKRIGRTCCARHLTEHASRSSARTCPPISRGCAKRNFCPLARSENCSRA